MKRLNLELCPHPYAFCKSSIKESPDGLFVTHAEAQARIAALEAQVQKLRFTPRELEVLEREIEGAVANCQSELAPIFKSVLVKVRAALQTKGQR